MAGFAKPLAELAEKEAAPVAESFAKGLANKAEPYWRSFFGMLKETKSGSLLHGMLQNQYEPISAHTSADLVAKGVFKQEQHDEAFKAAKTITKQMLFGRHNEHIVTLLKGVEKEKGFGHMNSIADGLSVYFGEQSSNVPNWRNKLGIKTPSPYKRPEEVEKAIKNGMSWLYLSRVVVPHLGQFITNSPLTNGVSATVKAVAEAMTSPKAAKEFTIRSGALESDIFSTFGDMMNGKDNWVTRIAKQPGFKFVRQWNTVLSVLAGKHAAMKAADDLIADSSDKGARIVLHHLGIDPEKILEKGALDEFDITTAGYRSASEVMHMSRGTTPYAWKERAGYRFMWLYKDFQYNQFRFVKDSIKRGFEQGWGTGLKTVALYTSLFPAVGETVKFAENAITGHSDDPKQNLGYGLLSSFDATKDNAAQMSEYIDAMAHAAAFGVGYSVMRSSKHQGLASWALGPIFATGLDVANDVLNLNGKSYESTGRKLGRTVLQRLPIAGPAIANYALPPLKKGRKRGR